MDEWYSEGRNRKEKLKAEGRRREKSRGSRTQRGSRGTEEGGDPVNQPSP